MSDKLPENQTPIMRVVPMVRDTNPGGAIFGGWIMSQADLAGAVIALRRAAGRVVTVAVDSFVFKQPIFVGDLVSLYGTVTRVGKTSLTVHIDVYAERGIDGEEKIVKVTEANFTYVAIDDSRQPRPIPPAK